MGDKSKIGKEHKIIYKASASYYKPSSMRESLSPLKIMPASQLIGVFQGEKHRIYLSMTWHDCIIRIREDKEIQEEN